MNTRTFAFALLILLSGNALYAVKGGVSKEKSSVKWMGKKIGSKHEGTIRIQEGHVEVQDNKIVAAKVVMDMTSIENTDLENENFNQKLVGHLKSDDFFGVETYPTATFELTQASEFVNGKATISGNITIKGNTEPLTVDVLKEGDAYLANIQIDRSKFDVRYGSKSFFNDLGDSAIDNIFTLEVKLVVN